MKTNKIYTYVLLLLLLVALGCTGKEMITKDKTPPTDPILIPHLGDPGNTPDSVSFNGYYVKLTDEANGIDAVPDVDGIRLTWQRFLDLDLNLVKIWRFDEFSLPRVIASIPPTDESFTDSKNVTMNGDSLYYAYSYFIEVFDRAGNSTISDTVSYRLLEKQIPYSPANGALLTTMHNLRFVFNTSNDYSRYRVLLFNQFHVLRWSTDIQTEHQTSYSIPYTGTAFTGETFSWRVDAFDWDSSLWDSIHNVQGMYIGSESRENTFTVQ